MAKRNYSGRNIRPKTTTAEHRINEHIKVPEVRLVGDNLKEISNIVGQQVESEVYRTHILRDWARELELDLVEIAPKAKPPVVKIIDYNKFLYNKKKKEKEIKNKAAKTVIKEIRFSPNTDDHDFDFKLKHARGFLEEGAKVKAYVHFRGRSIVFKDRGELLLLRFLKELEEFGVAENLPKLEGKRMTVIVSPKKKKK
ncbi:translation initiation factor IF-3 [Membranihabitans marinus]|uniref:translation initiation factor IF-3 n=1 Tax=Membranihabitans marinus TaxID=1227546 RepID=UPI001F004387|nr:translation initiation factor IF-3 [Membranihabitans marinus]